MPEPVKLLNTLRRAAEAFRTTPGRIGRFVQLPAGAEVVVAGDMHGNVENFGLLLKKAQLAQHPQRHLVLQEVVHGPFLYAAGGDKSHQLLDLLAALKCQFPDRVHFLIGNHELAQWQDQRIGKGDVDQNEVFRAGVCQAYGSMPQQIYDAYLALFAAANLVLRTANRVIVSHSVPAPRHLPAFSVERLERDELQPEDVILGGWLHSLVWDRDMSETNVRAFLDQLDGDLLVSGHIPCDEGFSVPNPYQLILDSKGTPACCCLVPTDRPLSQQDLLSGVAVL